MTALSFVWVHPYSQNSRCDIYTIRLMVHVHDFIAGVGVITRKGGSSRGVYVPKLSLRLTRSYNLAALDWVSISLISHKRATVHVVSGVGAGVGEEGFVS